VTEFVWPVRVYYEDTDSIGVVYYANYLRFLERARTEWLRSLGFKQDALMREDGIVFAVRKVSLDFVRPARFNDALEVTARLVKRGAASLDFQQQVRTQQRDLICQGQVRIACIDAALFRPRPIPKRLLEKIAHVE